MGVKVNDYGIGDSNIEALMLTADKIFKGFHKVSLTNYDTTSESQIAAGSVVECGGALYKFDSNETITGSPSDGTVYIIIVPGLTTCTAVYTNTAPTWNDSYQGFYGTGGTAGYRYLEFKMTKATAVWSNKTKIFYDDNQSFDILTANTINANTGIIIPAGGINATGLRHFSVSLSTLSLTGLFNYLSPYIPNTGDYIHVSGATYYGGVLRIHHAATRQLSTRIAILGVDATALNTLTINTPDATTGVCGLSW